MLVAANGKVRITATGDFGDCIALMKELSSLNWAVTGLVSAGPDEYSDAEYRLSVDAERKNGGSQDKEGLALILEKNGISFGEVSRPDPFAFLEDLTE